MYSTNKNPDNYGDYLKKKKAKEAINSMMPKTRTNLLGRKVKVEYNNAGNTKTKTITKKDGSKTIKSKRLVNSTGGPGPKAYIGKGVTKTVPSATGDKFVFEKSKSKDIGGLNRLFGKRRKYKYDAKTGVDIYKDKKTAFSKPKIEKYK